MRGSFAQVYTGQASAGNSALTPLHYMLGTLAISTKPVPGDSLAGQPGTPAAERRTPLLPDGLPRIALTAGSGSNGPGQRLVMTSYGVAEAAPTGEVVPPSLHAKATKFFCKQLVEAGVDARACEGDMKLAYAGHMAWDMAFAPLQANSLHMHQVAMPVHVTFGDRTDDLTLSECGLAYVRADMRRGPNALHVEGHPLLNAVVRVGDGDPSFPNSVIATGGNCGYTSSGNVLLPYVQRSGGVAVANEQKQPGLLLVGMNPGHDLKTVGSHTTGGHCGESGWAPGPKLAAE